MKNFVFTILVGTAHFAIAAGHTPCSEVLKKLEAKQVNVASYLTHLIQKQVFAEETINLLLSKKLPQLGDVRFQNEVSESNRVSYLKALTNILESKEIAESWPDISVELAKSTQAYLKDQEKIVEVRENTKPLFTPKEVLFKKISPGLDQEAEFTTEEVVLNGIKHSVARANGYVYLVNLKNFTIKHSIWHRDLVLNNTINIKGKEYFVLLRRNQIKFMDAKTLKLIKSYKLKTNIGSWPESQKMLLAKQGDVYNLFYYAPTYNDINGRLIADSHINVITINPANKNLLAETEITLRGKLMGSPVMGKYQGKDVVYQVTGGGLTVIDLETLKKTTHKIKISNAMDLEIKQVKYMHLNGEDIIYYGGYSSNTFYNLQTKKTRVRMGAGKIVTTAAGLLFVSTLYNKKQGLRLTGEMLRSFDEIDTIKGSFETIYKEDQIYNISADMDNSGIIALISSQTEIVFISIESGQEIYRLPVNLNLEDMYNDEVLDLKIVKNEKGSEVLLVLTVQGVRVVELYH